MLRFLPPHGEVTLPDTAAPRHPGTVDVGDDDGRPGLGDELAVDGGRRDTTRVVAPSFNDGLHRSIDSVVGR